MRKDKMDGFGFAALCAVMLLFAVNQIIIKEANKGFQPVFFAGARSALAVVFVFGWLRFRGLWGRVRMADLGPGLLIGTMFAIEFLCLFVALELTAVGRASVIFYSMPVWMGLLAHYFLPGEQLTKRKSLGLLIAFLGTAWAILSRFSGPADGSIWGDICALLGAWGWAGTAFIARKSRLREAGPEAQLFWMVLVSAPILLAVSPLFGPLLREVTAMHWVWLVVQASIVVAGGFIAWLWLLSVYPTSSVASFSFLPPVFAILLGHLIFAEPLSPPLFVAAGMVAVGIILINRRA